MATPIVHTESDSVIAGYFSSGDDAHRAINALFDEGFLPSQIGAAFHTSGGASYQGESGGSEEEALEAGDSTLQGAGTSVSAGSTIGGPASDDTAVQPGYLAGGAGTPFGGAPAPGPIVGSELTHTGLPSELKHELPHDAPGSGGGQISSPVVASGVPDYAPTTTVAHEGGTSWTSKLKHLFDSKKSTSVAGGTDQAFGTGEGYLNLTNRHSYSRPAFESSAARAGVPAEQTRHLSSRLSQGGAIVTVSETGRAIEVEKIFERYNGVVRFEGAAFGDEDALPGESSVEVFGHLHDHYGSR